MKERNSKRILSMSLSIYSLNLLFPQRPKSSSLFPKNYELWLFKIYNTAIVRFSPVTLEWNLAQTLLVCSRRLMVVRMGNNARGRCFSFSLNLINKTKSFNDSSFWRLTPSLMDIMIQLENLPVFCLCFFAPVTVFNAWPLERPCSIKTSIGLWKHLCMNTKVISKSIWKKRISWLRFVTLLTQIKNELAIYLLCFRF